MKPVINPKKQRKYGAEFKAEALRFVVSPCFALFWKTEQNKKCDLIFTSKTYLQIELSHEETR